MESTAFYPPHQRYTAFSYSTLSPDMYPSTLPPTPQSYLRSSAGQNYSPPSPHAYYTNTYSQPPSLVDGLADDSPSSSSSSNSGSFLSNHGNVQVPEHAQDYIPDYSNYHLAQPHPPNGYANSDSSAIPRQMWDPAMKQEGYSPYPSHPIEGQQNGTYPEDFRLYHGYARDDQHYVPADHMAHPHEQLSLASYYPGQDQHMPSDAPLGTYTTHGELQSVVTGFSNSPRLTGQDAPPEQMNSPQPAYVSSPSASSLQYPASPVEVHSAPPQAFVNLQDVSPSPTVSPDQVCSSLPIGSPTGYGFPDNSPFATSNSGSSYDYVDEVSAEVTSPALHRRPESTDRPLKKHRYASSEDEESRSAGSAADSGESEREDDADDADDDDYKPDDSKGNSRSGSRRRATNRHATARSFSPVDMQKPRLAPPVPVPNLTKKSRGRRVPTAPVVIQQNGIEKNIRGYKCKVPGCNKCFQRGEHLKRHVRSIHTNEKPHKCPWRNCGKDFSRHDNLRQHMRVHRNEPLDPQGGTASA